MLKYWNSGGCAGLGNLYILTVGVIMLTKAIEMLYGSIPDFSLLNTSIVSASGFVSLENEIFLKS